MKAWLAVLATAFLFGCSDQAQVHRTLKSVGAAQLREQSLATVKQGFPREGVVKIDETEWPAAVRAFRPSHVWIEPDGVYLLIDSDAGGERGVYVPRVLSEKDPICTSRLIHVKLDAGVYWYERKRA